MERESLWVPTHKQALKHNYLNNQSWHLIDDDNDVCREEVCAGSQTNLLLLLVFC